eukprot:5305008-Alexandrium_andersonii.AAC.1
MGRSSSGDDTGSSSSSVPDCWESRSQIEEGAPMAYCSNLPGEASPSPHPGSAGPVAAGEGDLQHEQP